MKEQTHWTPTAGLVVLGMTDEIRPASVWCLSCAIFNVDYWGTENVENEKEKRNTKLN